MTRWPSRNAVLYAVARPLLRLHLLLFPAACQACGRLHAPHAAAGPAAPYLCEACLARLPWHPHPAEPPTSSEAALHLDAIHAAFRYDDPVSGWIRGLKYHGHDSGARMLAALLSAAHPPAERLAGVDLLAPVPLHPRRVRQRGFNQSLLLTHHWRHRAEGVHGQQDESPATPHAGDPVRLEPELLARVRPTQSQARLDGEARQTNVLGAFAPGPALRTARDWPSPLEGLRILLVDDVMTTGATLGACAAVLKQAGAERVEALVLART